MSVRNFILVCAVLFLAVAVPAQQTAVLPDAPSTTAQKKNPNQKHELLADDPYRPLTNQEKLDHWVRSTYSPYTFFNAGVNTAFSTAYGDYRYCCGEVAMAKLYAASVADAESRYFFGQFLFPTILDQDPRYLPKRRGSMIGRAFYAATRVLVTKNDDGHSTFNTSEILGVAFSQALSNAYYPDHYRSWGNTGSRIYSTLQSDASGHLLQEFLPDIKRIFRNHAPARFRRLADLMSDD